MDHRADALRIGRRDCFTLAAGALAAWAGVPSATQAQTGFAQWVESFRPRAIARGVSDATYTRVMANVKPDTSVYAQVRDQPEFNEVLWQYLNRRVSDYRINQGRDYVKQHAALLDRIERDFGVDRYVLVALWGIESSYGELVANPKYMRPVIPALAALAYGEPRRRAYWEQELINALRIIERGWSTPEEMRGSWAGAMGHTQWMPEVWLNIGLDYDKDGRINPFGKPDDALASTASYLVKRGSYRRGEHWGYEVRRPNGVREATRSYAAWQKLGVTRADGQAFPHPNANARLWVPVDGGPAFLLGHNFSAVKTYNPSTSYTLAIVRLADRIAGGGPLVQSFPGSERAPTLAELQELQRRLTAAGFDTGGADGRVGTDTMKAVRAFQKKVGLEPADGYAGLKVLAKLRQM
jgi:peptidoglycan lytic transglycosylase B